MTDSSKSIALVGFTDPAARHLAESVRANDAFCVEDVASPLSQINGHAVDLANVHGVVLFRTDTSSDADLKTLHQIRSHAGGDAKIVAITEGSASLQSAHALTQAGADAVLPDTVSVEELDMVVKKALAALSPKSVADGGSHGHIISVAQARGGIGATTLAVNLADALLSRTGRGKKSAAHRVALVDLDLQFGAVAGVLDMQKNDSLYQLASEQIMPDAVFLEQSLVKLDSGLSVLPAPSKFAPVDALTAQQVETILAVLARSHDFVVVDMPRSLVGWISPVLEMSDRLLLVTDTAVPSIQQARRLIDFFTEDNLGLGIDMVVNFEKRPLIQGRHHQEAAKVLERPLATWLPPDPKTARDALDRGVPLSEIGARSPLTKAIRKLGKLLMSEMEEPAVEPKAAG